MMKLITINLPNEIKSIIKDEDYFIDEVGMSSSKVVIFKDKVLKIQAIDEESEHEYNIMKWLQGKLPVPKIIKYNRQENKSYLLMSKLEGKMSCEDEYLRCPELLTSLLAAGLKRLWQIDISNCPFSFSLDKKLEMAKYNVENNLVDFDNVEQDTFSKDGFKDAKELLKWLHNNKTQEELVFSHGDYCLPNIFLCEGKIAGYIDLSKSGICDKWQDIALCYRSLQHNFDGRYGGEKHPNFSADILFEKLGIEPNWEKIRYYILLDELF